MERTHKRALLAAVMIAAAFAGTIFALSPSWERHREEEKQEAMLSRIETSMRGQKNGLHIKKTEILGETGAAGALEGMVTPAGTVQAPSAGREAAAAAEEPEEATETAEEPGTGKKPENPAGQETAKKPGEDMPQAGAEIGILSIPEIDARLPVTAGVSEEQLKISEGWVMQTEMIGSVGNAVIAGHRSYTYGKHFNRLGELETGDGIFYTAADGTEMCFIVNEILTVSPDDPAVFAAPLSGGSQLTLYTCTPVKAATHRLLVRALRVEE